MITFENLSVKFNKDNFVLKNINLRIKEKEKVFFIGKSGVGKTTLFNCLMDRKIIFDGKLLFNNKNIKTMNSRQYKKLLNSFALISQVQTSVEELNVFNNVFKDIKNYPLILKLIGWTTKKNTQKILSTLDKVEILDKAFSKFKDLSGGQKQRVEICKELVNKHSLIIADEPTSSLDLVVAKKIILNLLENTQTTVLISVHNLDLIPNKSRVICIKDKKIVFDKKKANLTKKEIKFTYES